MNPNTPSSTTSRRGWIAAAAGLAIAGIGAGLTWRTSQRASLPLSEAEQSFWRQQFSQTNGQTFFVSTLRGKPLVLNFWATWCPPCIDELPLLNSFYSENKANGWQILGLAVDQKEPVDRFLTKSPLNFPVALAGFPGIEISKSLGNLSGSLPFTVVFNSDGQVAHRKIGRLTPADVSSWASLK